MARATVVRSSWRALALAMAWSLAAQAAPSDPPTADAVAYQLGSQDRVRVRVFEWRPSRDEVYAWDAINEEYVVGAGGLMMLPLVGEVRASGLTTVALAGIVAEHLKTSLGLVARPDVSVEIVQFRPFYITGQVEKPGEYPYRPGLTVMQAIALAGGLTRVRDLGVLRFEREVIASAGELRLLTSERNGLLVRKARLEAELSDTRELNYPVEIARREGEDAFRAAIKQERLIFQARRSAFETQTAALQQLKNHLETEVVSLRQQLTLIDRQISILQRELKSTATLVEKGLAVATRQLSLERSVAQAEGERLQAGIGLLKAQQEIARTEIGLLELRNTRSNDVTAELRLTQGKLDAVAAREVTAHEMMEETEFAAPTLLRRNRAREKPTFLVSHPGSGQPDTAPVHEATLLQPGDTLTVEVAQPELSLPPRRETRPVAQIDSPSAIRVP